MTPKEIQTALARPFDAAEVRFKPGVVKGGRALAIPYADCRVIQERLDEVVGVDGWMDDYQLLPDNSVVCRLRVRIGDKWITKTDVGSPSEQPDQGDRLKASFSDSLKRAAVKFGVGRFLYSLKAEWWDYDPVKRQFVQPPKLPGTPPVAPPEPKPPAPLKPIAVKPVAVQPLDTRFLPAEEQPRPCIDEDQARELRGLMEQKGAAEDDVCAHFGVRSVAQLTPRQYVEAISLLTKRAVGAKRRAG